MWDVLRWALIWAAAGTCIALLATFVAASVPRRGREQTLGRFTRAMRDLHLPVAANWSFKDSWAANLTGLITALAAVIAAFGDSLATVIPAVEVARFAVVAALATGVTALSPMVYATFTRTTSGDGKLPVAVGTVTGLILASSATLAGLFGALGGIGWVTVGRNGDHVLTSWIGWCLLMVSALVVAYALRTLLRLLTWATDGGSGTDAMADVLAVSCCGSERIGISLKLL